jgi:hypothetical protein
MQKVITISVDVNKLVSGSDETFAMGHPEVLNELLAEGWEIEDWSFLTDNPINGKVPMLVILNDDMLLADGEDGYEVWEEEEEDDEMLLDADNGEEEEDEGQKSN